MMCKHNPNPSNAITGAFHLCLNADTPLFPRMLWYVVTDVAVLSMLADLFLILTRLDYPVNFYKLVGIVQGISVLSYFSLGAYLGHRGHLKCTRHKREST